MECDLVHSTSFEVLDLAFTEIDNYVAFSIVYRSVNIGLQWETQHSCRYQQFKIASVFSGLVNAKSSSSMDTRKYLLKGKIRFHKVELIGLKILSNYISNVIAVFKFIINLTWRTRRSWHRIRKNPGAIIASQCCCSGSPQ